MFNFNLSKIFGKETAPVKKHDETFAEPVVVTEKKTLDPESRTFNFTKEEMEKFEKEGKSPQEIELLRKTVLNKLERARFENSN